jgi:hypothetical protein
MGQMTLDDNSILPDLVRVAECYEALAGSRPMPHRTDFSASRFRWMVGRMYLIDVLDGGNDFRIRLWGHFLEVVYGVDQTGVRIGEMDDRRLGSALWRHYSNIVASKVPHFLPGAAVWPNGASIQYQRLLLPFTDDAGEVSLILGAVASDRSNDDLVFFKGLGRPSFVLGDQVAEAAD